MKILILYEELAPYLLACVDHLTKEVQVSVICKRPNKVAPFKFEDLTIKTQFADHFNFESLKEYALEFEPDAIFCGGWSTKMYNDLCKSYSSKIPVVLGFDNRWNGSIKQRLNVVRFKFSFSKMFNRCFVPGNQQKIYALNLGFKEAHVRTGAYSCDHDLFDQYYRETIESKKNDFPKRILFVGRYAPEKGVEELWSAFISAIEETQSEWELWCAGKGDTPAVEHKFIKHLGFIQPTNLKEIISQCGVLVLPSRFEPWGVVMHEFCAAGFPIISSDQVGANEDFLRDNENGYEFPAGDESKLNNAFKKIMSLTDEEIFKMIEKSRSLGATNSPQIWTKTLLELIES